MTELRFAAVTKDNWGAFEALFESPGAPKYCWCTAWRDMPNRQAASNADRKTAISGFVKAGSPIGILACEGEQAIGWCSVAPRESLRKLSPKQDDAERDVWSIVCFYIPRDRRKAGLGRTLLDAAIAHAFEHGARTVEAYPVDPDSPSYRFMGFRKMYADRGFVEIGKAGSRRYVMRLER
jgi:GNAT superfamily N-acetyltransferase